MLSAVRRDVVFAIRYFRRSPGFAATAVLTLALGIGATTAIFSLFDGILLRPLPFPHPEQLVAISTLDFPAGAAPSNVGAAYTIGNSYPNFFDWQRQSHTFESLSSYDNIDRLFSKANGEGARVLEGGRTSANLFSTLGVAPALGRTFTKDEELPGHRVAILSHEIWVSDFAASPNAIGQTVKISDEPYTVVGVMPAGFHYPVGQPANFWSTFAIDAEGLKPGTSLRDDDRLSVIGRLKPDVSTNQSLAELNAIQRGLAEQYSEESSRLGVSISPLLDQEVSNIRPALSLLFAAVGIVLIISCANVAGLLLARANGRRAEIALRTALGASRIRVVRQLLVEALLLAFAGGVCGVFASFAILRTGIHLVPSDLPRLYNIAIDGRVLAFSALLSAGTSLIFGLLPAWRISKSDPATALRDGAFTTTSGRHRNFLHHALIVAQTALGFTLLIGSGLLIRSMLNLIHIKPGFDIAHTVYFDIALTNKAFPVPGKVRFIERILPEFAAIPGVERVSAGHPLPILWGSGTYTNFTIANHPSTPNNLPDAGAAVVMPGYFETLSIPLLRGRTIEPHDNDPKAAPVAVINQTFAKKYFPNEDPIGHYFTPTFEHTDEPVVGRQIVGIVGDTRVDDTLEPYQPQFFLPYAQDPSHQRTLIVMRVAGNPASYEDTVRRIVAATDNAHPVFRYRTFTESIGMEVAQPRFEAILLSGFAGIALLLSALGLYAVLSFVVSQRVRELGLRMAFGASRSDILRIVLQRALMLAGIGIGVGIAVSLFATRLISDALFRVEPMDLRVFFIVTLVLMLVSLIAAIVPALRAATADPMRTLREQ
ncbi:MAG TPA: ABC transporter permease [Terriglobales bacterium]|nr:ABC transporter permease [Terriglobales bacterium]